MTWTRSLAIPPFEPATKPPMTPVATVSSASTAAQWVVETNLAHCGEDLVRLQPKRPTIVAIGEVVRLRGWMTEFQQTNDRQTAPAGVLSA